VQTDAQSNSGKKKFPIRTTADELKKLVQNISDATNTPCEELKKNLKIAAGAQNFSNWWNGKSLTIPTALKVVSTHLSKTYFDVTEVSL